MKKNKKKPAAPRNMVVLGMILNCKGGIMKDRRMKRMEQRERRERAADYQ